MVDVKSLEPLCVGSDATCALDLDSKTKKKIQSSIPELSVGDERKCFNQIRKAAIYIRPESLLWNGWPAGKFALDYVIGHHMKRKKKAEEKQDNLPDDMKKQRRTRAKVFDALTLDNDMSMTLEREEIIEAVEPPQKKQKTSKNAVVDLSPPINTRASSKKTKDVNQDLIKPTSNSKKTDPIVPETTKTAISDVKKETVRKRKV